MTELSVYFFENFLKRFEGFICIPIRKTKDILREAVEKWLKNKSAIFMSEM